MAMQFVFPAFLFWVLTASVQAEPPTEDRAQSDEPTAKEAAAPNDGGDRRIRRLERWRRFQDANPRDRVRMRAERIVERAVGLYELDDEQKRLALQEIQKAQLERREAMGPLSDERDKLRSKMADFWRRRWRQRRQTEEGDAPRPRRRLRDDPDYLKLRTRIREIEQAYPTSMQDSLERIEALLPEAQARKGRERWEARLADRRPWRRDAARDRREQVENTLRALEKALRESQPTISDEELQKTLKRVRENLTSARNEPLVRPELQARLDGIELATAPAGSVAMHPWEKHTREFLRKHESTVAQQAAAMSILREARRRAGQIERSNAAKIEKAEKLADKAERQKRLKELDRPVEQQFATLKLRLEALLTAAQRARDRN